MVKVETRIGDRLDLLATTYLLDPMKWGEIVAANPLLSLTKGFYVPSGLLIEIPELLPETIPDLLPWEKTDPSSNLTPTQIPVIVPPVIQPGSNPSDILSGSGWLTPAEIRVLLNIPDLSAIANMIPLTAIGVTIAPLSAGVVPFINLPAYPTLTSLGAISLAAIGVSIAPLSGGLVPPSNLPAYPTLASLGAISASAIGVSIAPLSAGVVPLSNLPAYPTLTSLGGVSTGAIGVSVASLVGGVVPVNQIPLPVQFQLLARTGAVATDFNTMTANHGSVRYFDSTAVNPNAPNINTSGSLLQYDSLFSATPNLWKSQTFIGHNGRRADRSQNNGVWGGWSERAYLNGVQPFSTIQDFSVGAKFRAGGIPAVTTTMTQAGVDASGNPRYWLVNATASTGNRLKSITIAANGNIQFRHHADDGTDGNVLEHTASGNVLTNGTVRCGGGTVHFTGASFVPGALYFRSDIGMLLYSDGTNWRRMDTNAIV